MTHIGHFDRRLSRRAFLRGSGRTVESTGMREHA
jgi:hypothetical protein